MTANLAARLLKRLSWYISLKLVECTSWWCVSLSFCLGTVVALRNPIWIVALYKIDLLLRLEGDKRYPPITTCWWLEETSGKANIFAQWSTAFSFQNSDRASSLSVQSVKSSECKLSSRSGASWTVRSMKWGLKWSSFVKMITAERSLNKEVLHSKFLNCGQYCNFFWWAIDRRMCLQRNVVSGNPKRFIFRRGQSDLFEGLDYNRKANHRS